MATDGQLPEASFDEVSKRNVHRKAAFMWVVLLSFALLLLVISPVLTFGSLKLMRSKVAFWRVFLVCLAVTFLGGAITLPLHFMVASVPLETAVSLVLLVATIWIWKRVSRLSIGRTVLAYILATAAMVGCTFLMIATVVQSFVVPTESMAPTLLPGDRILVDRLTPRLRPPRRGEVIAYRPRGDAKSVYVKRVAAVGGDRVEVSGETILVNGQKAGTVFKELDSSLVQYPLVVPPGQLYVLGDSPQMSMDSRFPRHGLVDESAVVGFPVLIYASIETPATDVARRLSNPESGTIRWGRIFSTVR